MHNVIDIVAPIFGLGLLGYMATRLGYFSDKHAEGMTRFIFNFAAPLFLIRLFSHSELPESIPWKLFGSFYLPMLFVYGLTYFGSRSLYGKEIMPRTLFAFGSTFGNVILIGLPLIIRAFGEEGALIFFLLFSIHDIFIFLGTNLLLEYGRHHRGNPLQVLRSLAIGISKNPVLVALFIGLILNFTETSLPVVLDEMGKFMQQAIVPVALFTLGSTLTRFSIRGRMTAQIMIIGMKNFIFPAMVWVFATYIFKLPGLSIMVATFTAALPSGLFYQIIADRYQVEPVLAASTVFFSSLLSLFTLSGLIYLFTN